MQQADDVSSYAREDRPRIHGVRSLNSVCIINTRLSRATADSAWLSKQLIKFLDASEKADRGT